MLLEIDEIIIHLKPLVGLKLSNARRAADMRMFLFSEIRTVERGTVGDFALHIQCPWRIEGNHGIVTGRYDLWKPADPDQEIDWDHWDYDKNENLQDKHIGEFLGGYDPQTRSFVNRSDELVVQGVFADAYGGAVIELSGGYRLVLFPDGTRAEDWRIFKPEVDEPHFVIVGGKIEDT